MNVQQRKHQNVNMNVLIFMEHTGVNLTSYPEIHDEYKLFAIHNLKYRI